MDTKTTWIHVVLVLLLFVIYHSYRRCDYFFMDSSIFINKSLGSWSANRCKATVSDFIKPCTKIITRYRKDFPATLRSPLFNIETNHQDTRPYDTLVCRAISGLMVSMSHSSSAKNLIRKGEWLINVIRLSIYLLLY